MDQNDLVHLLFDKMGRDMNSELINASRTRKLWDLYSMKALEGDISNPYLGIIATLSVTGAIHGKTVGLLVHMITKQLRPEAFTEGETEETLQLRFLDELLEMQRCILKETATEALHEIRGGALRRMSKRSGGTS